MKIKILLVMMAFVPGSFSSHAQQFTQKENFEKWLEGEWVPLFQECENQGTLTFFDSQAQGRSVNLIRFEYILSDSAGLDGSFQKRSFNFEVSHDGGNSFHAIENSEGMLDTVKGYVYFIDENVMVHASCKSSKRVRDHLARPVAFIRSEAYKSREQYLSETQIRKVLIIAVGFTGHSWIAHEQANGEPEERDENGRIILRIPKSGYLLTQAPPMPAVLALQNFEFYYEDMYEEAIPVPRISYNCLNLFRTKWHQNQLKDEDIIEQGFDMDKVYALAFSFNVPSRGRINEMFGENIDGQVMHFQVDTLRNLIRFGDTGLGR